MSSPKASGGLNPEMVYPPVSSPAPTPRGNTSYLRIDESEDPRYRFRVQLAWVIRLVFAILNFTVLLGILLNANFVHSRRFTTPLFVLLWFVFIWQLLHISPRVSRVQRGLARLLPRIALQIGDSSCVLVGDADGEREDFVEAPAKKNLARLLTTAVDFLLGLGLIVLGALWCKAGCYHYSNWMCHVITRNHLPFMVISLVLGSLMVLASFFSLFNVYHTIAFEFSVYKDGTMQPISLGDPDSDVCARREPVSIAA